MTGKASELLVYYNLAMVIPSFFVVTTLGALSDKVGHARVPVAPKQTPKEQQQQSLLFLIRLVWLRLPFAGSKSYLLSPSLTKSSLPTATNTNKQTINNNRQSTTTKPPLIYFHLLCKF